MKINSQMDLHELSLLMGGASMQEAKFMRQILIDECRESTTDYAEADFLQVIETARRFAEENPEQYSQGI